VILALVSGTFRPGVGTATKRLLSTWIKTPRRSGTQRTTARSTYADTLLTNLGLAIMTDEFGRHLMLIMSAKSYLESVSVRS
jgi:hypothetical protein